MALSSLGSYDILEPLGEGTTGVVFRAVDRRDQRQVALKILRPALLTESDRRGRFLREARAAAFLVHPHIATIYEVGEELLDADGLSACGLEAPEAPCRLPFLAIELLDGADLGTLVAQRAPMALGEALDIAAQIVDALGAAHRAGIVHRDLKPANVRITSDGRAKLLDFGLAKILPPDDFSDYTTASQLTLDGMVMGTLPYLPPEQLQATDVDGRADLFSVGVMLYEMLTGRLPFPSATLLEYARALISSQVEPPSRHRPDLPPWLDELVLRLLRIEPERRFQSGAEVAVVLRRHLAATLEPAAIPPALPGPPPVAAAEAAPGTPEIEPRAAAPAPSGWSRRWLPLAAALAVVVLIAALYFWRAA
jgi:serine/threonine protein kinase